MSDRSQLDDPIAVAEHSLSTLIDAAHDLRDACDDPNATTNETIGFARQALADLIEAVEEAKSAKVAA